jgi:DNA primase
VREVIGDFVQLKRAGSNFKGLSPFSDERSPSLWFRPLKGFGKILVLEGVFAFVMEHEHFTYPEAIRYLARKYNIEIEETEQTNEKKANTDIREYVSGF